MILLIENLDPNNINIDKKSYKNMLIYNIRYMTIKEYVKTYRVNPLYLILRYTNEYFA